MGRMDSGRASGGGRPSSVSADALRQIVTLAASMPSGGALCPGCGAREPRLDTGLCRRCAPAPATASAELARARKRRWWAEHGREWRAARRAVRAVA